MSTVLNNINLDEIKLKLYERLKPSGWADKLKTFIMSSDMDQILKALLKEVQEGRRFTPVLKQVFRAFEECPYDKLKIVIVGQDPYPYPGVADGIAFSCSNDKKIQPSLRYMFKELEDTVYPEGYDWDPDLKRWSNQGILMLNTALTTTINKIGAHYDIWKPFLIFLFDMLKFRNTGLIYVFMGKKAQEFGELVSDLNWKIVTSHPASAAYNNEERWDSGDLFNKINEIMYSMYKEKIEW
jgi:uracil-DNA glycosylase